MKVLPELHPKEAETAAANILELPKGLIGFPAYHRAELRYLPENLPFLWLTIQGPPGPVNFVVVEPAGLIPGYELELFDADAASIGLEDAADALVLNIVALRPQAPLEATVNLIGPIVVNRRTRVARQVVIANNSHYSARHPLLQNEACASANT